MSGITALLSAFTQPAGGGGGTSYRYYRVIQANSGTPAISVGELELFLATTAPAHPSNASDLTTGLGASAYSDNTYFGTSAANVFDDNDTTEWANGAAGAYVGIDMGSPVAARSANLVLTYLASSVDVLLQGSTDNAAWTTLATITSPTATTYALAW